MLNKDKDVNSMWSKFLVIGIIVLLIVWVMAIMNVASMEDDASEKRLEEHRNNKS